jgi:hypothetical protein
VGGLHAGRFEHAVVVGREADGRSEAGRADRAARLAGTGTGGDGRGDPNAEAAGVAHRCARPPEAGTGARDLDAGTLVDTGEPPATDGHGQVGVGVADRHVHARDGRPGRVVPLRRDAVGGGPQRPAGELGQAAGSDGVDLQEAATDDRALRGHVGPHAAGQAGGGLVGIDNRVDEQPAADRAPDRRARRRVLSAHEQYAIIY